MLKWSVVGVLIVMLACSKGESPRPATVPDQPVTVVGENYCLGCALNKRAGAVTQCDVYGHRHVLRVESAVDADDKPIEMLTGETLHYLDNDKSAALVDSDDFHDKRVRVKGRLFVRERTIEVQEAASL